MANEYHLLHFIPAIEAWEMPPILEGMAKTLVESGRLRINADDSRNFVKYSTVDTDRAFSARELTDEKLLPTTRKTIAQSVPIGLGEQAVEDVIERLQQDLKKARGIEEEKEMKVARVLMQSAHPAVMMLALHEGTEFFVSYSHNVGDLMAVHFWDTHGTAGGLQAVGDEASAVYVSCMGDPFFEGERKTYTTDGWPALARMVVIAGQEIGHYADLLRDKHGVYGRVSASFSPLAPRAECKKARDADMLHVRQLVETLNSNGLRRLHQAENIVDFYDSRLKFSPQWLLGQAWRFMIWTVFTLRNRASIPALRTHPKLRRATAITHFLQDMSFNLAPVAEVYRRADPVEEEAIACIEALARVPQQVNKWGHAAVAYTIPYMYRLYYGSVIPNVSAMLGKEALNFTKIAYNVDKIQRLKVFATRMSMKRPAWHPKWSQKAD